MSTANQGSAVMPTPVLDVIEASDKLRRWLADPENVNRTYTSEYTGEKTDLGTTPGAAVTASRTVLNTDIHAVLGWAIAETTGEAGATIRLRDGGVSSGEVFGRINLQANESVRDWFIPHGIRCRSGRVFLEVISGSVEGVVYWL